MLGNAAHFDVTAVHARETAGNSASHADRHAGQPGVSKIESKNRRHAVTHKSAARLGSTADARELFSAIKTPFRGAPHEIGRDACGCLSGAVALPQNGPHWQVMRLSRNRFYAHPEMIDYIKKMSERAAAAGWNGVLVGDLSMPRGGPMPGDHASHQKGSDGDFWLTPAPKHKLTARERETMQAGSVLKIDKLDLNPDVWTEKHANFVRAAAQDPRVGRIFVTPAIKRYFCEHRSADGSDEEWLRRFRPYEGHDDHIHVRLKCPKGDETCVDQEPPPEGDGCGAELEEAFKTINPPYTTRPEPEGKPKPFPLSKLPAECANLLNDKRKPAP